MKIFPLSRMFKQKSKIKNTLLFIKELGFNPKNILDIGAYHGEWTLDTLKVFPTSNYILIEPNNHIELKRIKNKHKVINALLADEVKQVDWFENGTTGDSIYKENTQHYRDCKVSKKETTTLDKIFNSGENFDLIKIDTQGGEIPVLKGGIKLVKQASFIILEMPFMGKYNTNVPNFMDHIAYMNEIGFIPYDIIELHRINKNILIQVDIIFINKSHDLNNIVQEKISKLGETS